MSEQRFLITGALGCIGAWVVRCLVREGVPVATFDLAGDPHRLRLILDDDELARVQFITGDITDLGAFEAAVKETGATHLIHLAGLQVPFCKADPALGARVNVVGTVNVFEAAKRAGLRRVVYASSIAVYGLSEEYPDGPIGHDALPRPRTHYGVYKQANEGTARIYWLDDGISSIGLRPYIVYGPARDQGMTSQPTKAMLAAALGRPHHIPFGGRSVYQYTEDTARAFIQAARSSFEGAGAFNLGGTVAHHARDDRRHRGRRASQPRADHLRRQAAPLPRRDGRRAAGSGHRTVAGHAAGSRGAGDGRAVPARGGRGPVGGGIAGGAFGSPRAAVRCG